MQKDYINKNDKEKEKDDDIWEKVKKKSLKAVIDTPIKSKNNKNYKGIYNMLMARKENFEEDVLANFRMKQLNSGNHAPVDKYEGDDIYEDIISRKKTDFIRHRNKIPIKSPKKSPKNSPKNSPGKSPQKSPQKSPGKSPKKSPHKIVYKSPILSPIKSPKKNNPDKSPIKSPGKNAKRLYK